ncbi:MAG TPA: nickel pincer cofactor biosynthesis protein LarB [Terriglobales bacterium]|nr:nickel pincer cofactor biosynthesis protein LarB [Terriglobales bacterium]
MNRNTLHKLLQEVRSRKLSPDEAVQRLRHLPFEDLGFAKLDHHRALRHGMPEVIFSQGKTAAQVAKIFSHLASHHPESNILATRATEEQFRAVSAEVPQAEYRALARCITLRRDHSPGSRNRSQRGQRRTQGTIAVVSAGTSDIPIAEEAVITAELMGNHVESLYDVGVAGIHRLLAHRSVLAKARVIIVCAGMEGALPSVVGGLVGVPVVAVPTSVGYGASFDGLAALLGMLNSCASNVSVVNIDNGFGAAYVASLINQSAR